MKRFIVLACMTIIAVSCSAPKAEDPAISAIKASIAEKVGEGAKISMVSFEKIGQLEHLGVSKVIILFLKRYSHASEERVRPICGLMYSPTCS